MKTFFTSILTLITALTFGQYSLSGVVIGSDGSPLESAQVSLDQEHLTYTDNEGNFSLENLASGTYTLEVSFVGFQAYRRNIAITSQDRYLDITLRSDATLDEVLVTSIRVNEEDPFTYSSMDEEEIEARNLGQDIPMLTKFLPGVVASSDAGAGIGYTYMRVRGSDATRINVTINGVPYNDAESQGTFWVDLPDVASSMSSIQLQRGVGTSTNGGSAFGASLNLLTDGFVDDSYVRLSSSIGSYGTKKGTLRFGVNTLEDKLSLSGRMSLLQSDGYVDRAYSDLNGYTLQAAYNHPKRYVKVVTFGGHEETYQAWYGLTKDQLKEDRRQNPYTYENEVDNYRQDHVQLHWNELLSDDWSARMSLNYTKGKGYFEQFEEEADPALYANIFVPTSDGKADIAVRRWLDNNFYFGYLSASHTKENMQLDLGASYGHYLGDHYGKVEKAITYVDEASKDRNYYFSDSRKDDISAFAKSTWKISDKISGYVDLQGRQVQYATKGSLKENGSIDVDTSYTFFNPKLGFNWLTPNGGNAYISYARANREPNRDDFQYDVTNHETMDNVELGYRKRTATFQYGVNTYLMYYKNQLVLTGALNDVGVPIRETSGKSYRLGLEVEGGYDFSSQWNLYANATFSHNKNIDFNDRFDGETRELGQTDISFSPNLISSAILTYRPVKGLDISLYNKYVSEQYMSNTEAEGSKLDDYMIQDFGVNYRLSLSRYAKEITFKLLVNNILDKEYVDRGYYYTYDGPGEEPGTIKTYDGAGYYPQATRNFLVGIDILF